MLGNPKYNVGDAVYFNFENKRYEGRIYIVDAYGTFEDNSDVSYDIMVYNDEDYTPKCLYKHISEKIVNKL